MSLFRNADNAHALFVRATYLVCHRLISSWKTDLNVSLAALELLSGLSRMNIKDSGEWKFDLKHKQSALSMNVTTIFMHFIPLDPLECKRAVKWICDYICYQCSRPPPAHSKDLHSTIVAAFQCTSAWLIQHPHLMQDKECLTTVLEVIELGISGTKSVGKPGEPIKLKEDKELKPVSMRVREAAETLLTLLLEQVGFFPNECGPQSISSLLDEITLYKHCISHPTEKNDTSLTAEEAVQKFRYFVTENSTILALLEEPLGNDQDPQPTITCKYCELSVKIQSFIENSETLHFYLQYYFVVHSAVMRGLCSSDICHGANRVKNIMRPLISGGPSQ